MAGEHSPHEWAEIAEQLQQFADDLVTRDLELIDQLQGERTIAADRAAAREAYARLLKDAVWLRNIVEELTGERRIDLDGRDIDPLAFILDSGFRESSPSHLNARLEVSGRFANMIRRAKGVADRRAAQSSLTRSSRMADSPAASPSQEKLQQITVHGHGNIIGLAGRDATQQVPASDALQSVENSSAVRQILDAIENLRARQPETRGVDIRSFDFVRDEALRRVVSLDYVDAQCAFSADAFKPAAITAAGVLEGMLTDALQWPEIAQHADYERAVRPFSDRSGGGTQMRRAGLVSLINAAAVVDLLDPVAIAMARGAADYRNTTHPLHEAEGGRRVGREEAQLVLALVQLVYRDLSQYGVRTVIANPHQSSGG